MIWLRAHLKPMKRPVLEKNVIKAFSLLKEKEQMLFLLFFASFFTKREDNNIRQYFIWNYKHDFAIKSKKEPLYDANKSLQNILW